MTEENIKNDQVINHNNIIKNGYKPYIFIGEIIRKRRSTNYIKAFSEVGMSSLPFYNQKIGNLAKVLCKEFPELKGDIPSNLIAIIGACTVQNKYEIFVVDFEYNIIKYFLGDANNSQQKTDTNSDAFPEEFEKARSLALSGYYTFIEIYKDWICAINKNGFPSVYSLKGNLEENSDDSPENAAEDTKESEDSDEENQELQENDTEKLCPICKTPLRKGHTSYFCVDCAKTFPLEESSNNEYPETSDTDGDNSLGCIGFIICIILIAIIASFIATN